MADLLPDGFILTPFCPDLDQAIFEHRSTVLKLWQICFQMASFGHLSVQILIKPFSNSDNYLKAIQDLFPNGFILTPFSPDLDQVIFEPRHTIPKLWQICFQMASFGHLSNDLLWTVSELLWSSLSLWHNSICAKWTFWQTQNGPVRISKKQDIVIDNVY